MAPPLLPYVEVGLKSGEALVFLSGYPDDELSACAPLVDRLKAKHRILAICMPDMQLKKSEAHLAKPWGYSFAEIDQMLDGTIAHVLGKDAKFTLIIHDWGSIYGTVYQNKRPPKVSRVVMMDVGIKRQFSLYDAIVILIYQWWFAVAFVSSQFFGILVGNILLQLFFLFANSIPSLTIGTSGSKLPRAVDEIGVHMCYPYYHFWKAKFTMRSAEVNMLMPSCPVLYMVIKIPLIYLIYHTNVVCAHCVCNIIVRYQEKCYVSR